MRKIATVLAGVTAAGTIALCLPASAMAADGSLNVGGTWYQNPRGCYNSATFPMAVTNMTNQFAYAFSDKDCQGAPVSPITGPGEYNKYPNAVSVYIG